MAVEREAPRQKKKMQEQDKAPRVKRAPKETPKSTTETKSKTSQSTMSQLQQQVGNRAAQRLLVQRGQSALALAMNGRQAPQEREADDEEKTKKITEVGKVKIERPKVEYYDVSGNNFHEASRGILQDGKWFECRYRYINKVEKGIIKRVDIIIEITLKVPQWRGLGWDMASDDDKRAWLQLLEAEQVNPSAIEELTRLPSHFLGLDMKKAPDQLKGEWRTLLESIQRQEQGYEDIAWRRAIALQRRLFQQPDQQAKTVFDQFEKDLKIELDAYNRQKKFGKRQKVSLGANSMVQ